jgi:hypothetical protein
MEKFRPNYQVKIQNYDVDRKRKVTSSTVKRENANWVGHILRRNFLL